MVLQYRCRLSNSTGVLQHCLVVPAAIHPGEIDAVTINEADIRKPLLGSTQDIIRLLLGGIVENRPNLHLFTLGGAQGGESGIFTDFAHTSNGCHFLQKGSFILIFFCLKAKDINFHFLQNLLA